MVKRTLNELSFEILQQCPNNCIYCSSNASIHSEYRISYNTFVSVIDDAVKLGMKRLCISGGEPFLHSNILEMVSYAKQLDIEVYIYTSGITLDEEGNYNPINELQLKNLKDVGLDKLIFNVQAVNKDLYNKIMGTEDCFKHLDESIKRASHYDIFTEIHFVPMLINYEAIDNIIHYAIESDIKKVSFLRLVLQGRAQFNKTQLSITDKEINEFKSRVKFLRDIYKDKIDVRFGIPLTSKQEGINCNAGWEKLIIRYDGAVFPCEAFKYLSSFGNENDTAPNNINDSRLLYIWENSNFLNLIRKNINEFHSNENCETCPAQRILKSGLLL